MPASQLETQTYCSLEELETIREKWEELLASYLLSTPFSTPEWLIPWWRSFGKSQELFVVAFFANGSQLVGLAPLSITRIRVGKMISLRLLRLMGDGSQDSDNLDLPVRPGFEDRFAASLLNLLERGRTRWDVAEFNTMPPDSPAGNGLRRLLMEKEWAVREKNTPASRISLPSTWEEYLQLLSSEDRKNLERYARRIEKRYATKMYRCSDEGQLTKCLEAMFAHHQAQWEAAGERGSFGSIERRRFYYDLSRQLLKQGRLDLWAIELDGEVVAAQFGFRYADKVFQLQEGNDPKHAADRVGFLLRGHVMKELIAQGVRTYDFLGGELGYKAKWGARAEHYLNFRFAKPFTQGAAYLQAQSYAGRGKSWLRRNLPSGAWKILHNTNVALKGRKTPLRENAPKEEKPSDQSAPNENEKR